MTAKKKKRTYQSDIASASLAAGLGLPPLKMILVHAENDRRNAAAASSPRNEKTDPEKERAVRRIIEHLNKQ